MGVGKVTLRAGDFHRDLGLANSYPSVCQVLQGGKLHSLANVKIAGIRASPTIRAGCEPHVGKPVSCDTVVASGIPPSSSPAGISASEGIRRTMASQIVRSNSRSDSNRYLSKYSSVVSPVRSTNFPCRYARRLIS